MKFSTSSETSNVLFRFLSGRSALLAFLSFLMDRTRLIKYSGAFQEVSRGSSASMHHPEIYICLYISSKLYAPQS